MQKILNNSMKEYYAKRAIEYEAIYHRKIPDRLKEQQLIADRIKKIFTRKYVLELACGTGFWTKYLVGSANKVVATDINHDMLKIASKMIKAPEVQFLESDAYNPLSACPPFNGVMANFWFSHIPREKIGMFLKKVHSSIADRSVIFFADGVYRKELGGELIQKKNNKNTYKKRMLNNGEEYFVLKNYYTEKELYDLFRPYSKQITVSSMSHFWTVTYTLSKKQEETQ